MRKFKWYADKHLRCAMWISLVLCVVAQYFFEKYQSWPLGFRIWRSTNPNFIAAIVAALLVQTVLRWRKHEKYLAALLPVREHLRNANLGTDKTRKMVAAVVQSASILCFESSMPEILSARADENSVPCNTCLSPSALKEGRCPHCGDIYESWCLDKNLSDLASQDPTK